MYQEGKLLGEGSYGKVYEATHIETQEKIALKKFEDEEEWEYELKWYQKMSHPNILHLIASEPMILIFELIEQDLYKRINERPVQSIKSCLRQILKALEYLHDTLGIIHGDLKSQNVLIDKDGKVKLCDFGHARRIGDLNFFGLGTMWFAPPEQLLGSRRNRPANDIWAVGCIMAELTNGLVPFQGDSEIDQLYIMYRTLGTPTPEICPNIVSLPEFKDSFPKWKRNEKFFEIDGGDLLSKMFEYDPEKRISVKEALLHPFLKE